MNLNELADFTFATLLTEHDADAALRALQEHAHRYNAEGRDGFAFGFTAGLAHARQWRPLTDDPATWPEEGQRVVLCAHNNLCAVTMWFRATEWWTGYPHWLPLPPPEAK